MKLKKMLPVALMAILLGSTVAYAFTGNGFSKNAVMAEEFDEELVPETYEQALELVNTSEDDTSNIRVRRFILWTQDGINVMWGRFGNGYFVGEDNNGKECWGIYYKGTFMGFYDGEPFQGKYRGRGFLGFWKAEGLFGLDESRGGFLTFPRRWRNSNQVKSMKKAPIMDNLK